MAKRNVKNEKKRDLNTDAEYRSIVFEKLLKHIRGGYSIDCFTTMSAEKIELFLNLYWSLYVKSLMRQFVMQSKGGRRLDVNNLMEHA